MELGSIIFSMFCTMLFCRSGSLIIDGSIFLDCSQTTCNATVVENTISTSITMVNGQAVNTVAVMGR